MSISKLHCPTCLSSHIQIMVWYDPNNDDVVEELGYNEPYYGFCNGCEEDITTKPKETEEILHHMLDHLCTWSTRDYEFVRGILATLGWNVRIKRVKHRRRFK